MDKKKQFELFVVIGVTCITFFVLLILTRSITSGYHMVDDHVVIDLFDTIKDDGFYSVMKESVASDMEFRFRPLYSFVCVVKTLLFGDNLNIWMGLSMLEGIFTTVLLYYMARNLKFTIVEAMLFTAITLFGMQFTPWYRALNQENEGTLYMAVSFYLVSYVYQGAGKHLCQRKTVRAIIMLFALLSSLQKEAFVLALPCILFFILFLYHMEYSNKEETFIRSIWLDIKDNLDYVCFFCILFIVEIIIIIFFVGTDYSYAGFDSTSTVHSYLQGIFDSLKGTLFVYVVLASAAILCILISCKDIDVKEYGQKYFWLYLLCAFGFSTQLLLHAKSGMWERYLLPFLFFWNLLFVLYALRWISKSRLVYCFFMAVCITVMSIGFKDSWNQAKGWSRWGHATQAFYQNARMKIEETRPDKVLIYIDPAEPDMSTGAWLRHNCRYGDFVIYDSDTVTPGMKYDVILIYKYMWDDDGILASIGVERSDYEELTAWDAYTVAVYKE